MTVNEPLKTMFYLPHYASLLRKASFKTDYAHLSKLCQLKCIILLEKQHFSKFFSTQIFAMKVDGAIKTIFYLTHYTFLLK